MQAGIVHSTAEPPLLPHLLLGAPPPPTAGEDEDEEAAAAASSALPSVLCHAYHLKTVSFVSQCVSGCLDTNANAETQAKACELVRMGVGE